MENFSEKVLMDMIKGFLPDFSENQKDENLIRLGLTSIQVMDVANKLKKYGIRIPVFELGTTPVFHEWMRLAAQYGGTVPAKSHTPEVRTETEEFPLSEIQQAYWFGRNSRKQLGNVSCHVYLELDGKNVSPERLAKAWKQIFLCHPMMRMCILPSGRQRILPQSPYDTLEIFDFTDCSAEETEQHLQAVRKERSQRKLQIDKGETAGLALSLLPENKTRIHFDLDLIAADVMSFYLIMNDLCKLYRGTEPDVPADWNYSTYLAHQQTALQEESNAAEIFWKQKVTSLPGKPELPVKESALEKEHCSYQRHTHKISRETWKKFEKVCTGNSTTPAMALLTIYASALERWSANNRFLINLPIFNRDTNFDGIEKVVADFTNLLLVDAECSTEQNFSDREKHISTAFRENLSHSAFSGIKVQKLLREKNQDSAAPIAPVVYSYTIGQKLLDDSCLETFGTLGFMISQTPQVYLDFQIVEAGDTILFSFDTPEELFEETVIQGIFSDMNALFDRVTESGGDWNFIPFDEESISIPEHYALPETKKLLYTDFLKCVAEFPDKNALVSAQDGSSLTYQQLKEQALRVAQLLKENGMSQGDAVAVTLPRGFSQIIAIYGILFAGGHYVPVGTHLPFERRKKIYSRCRIQYVLTDAESRQTMEYDASVRVIDIAAGEHCSVFELTAPVSNTETAYIILTSGTTGEPKGVEVSHYSAINTLDAVNEIYHISSSDTALALSAIDFDLSVYDIFGILGRGGTLVTLNSHNAKDNMIWLKAVQEYHVTVWNSVPVIMEMLLMGAESLHSDTLPLKTVMLSGDWISLELPERIFRMTEHCEIAAMGGATEGAVWSNLYQTKLPLREGWTSIPYGYPLPGQLYRIVDSQGRDCRPYVKGELWIGGCGVAKGYAGDPETTASKFVTEGGLRWYRTGDFGRYREEQLIEFLGREDAQIKLNGYRVELGEIESMMSKIPQISAAAAVFDKKHEKIAAFYTGDELDNAQILEQIRVEVPEYMLPSVIVHLDVMPVTANTKIDRRALVRQAEDLHETMLDSTASMQETPDTELTGMLRELLGSAKLDMNAGFIANNGDSIQAMKLATWLKEKLNVEINAFDILNVESLTEIEDEIKEQRSADHFSL